MFESVADIIDKKYFKNKKKREKKKKSLVRRDKPALNPR